MCRELAVARRPTRAVVRWVVPMAAIALTATACTGHAAHTDPSASGSDPVSSVPASSPSPSPTALSAPVTHAPSQATSVLSAATPEQASVQISRALFASSPVAVVASPDAAALRTASRDAEQLGVPLLVAALTPAAGESSAPASGAPASGGPAASAPASGGPAARGADATEAEKAIADELRRLGSTRVVLVGAAGAPKGVKTVDAGALSAMTKPAALSDTTVLVHAPAAGAATAAADAAIDAAVTATARSAGATVVPVNGFDPRGDAAAIKALTSAPLTHVVAVGAGFGPADRLATRVAVAHTGAQLPAGGQLIFPGHRFVAIYGHPGGAALGILGAQDVNGSIARVRQLAAPYQPLSDVPVVPTFEIIATTASGAAGPDGNYSNESSIAELKPWVDAARAAGLYVVLDIQCGRADPLAQAKIYAPLLALPNVGLAVDPEWALTPTQLPLKQIGSLDSSRINAVGDWLDSFTAAHHLPQKLFVVHQFTLRMIGHEASLKTDYDNVAILIHMDGQGTPSGKESTWHLVTTAAPKGVPFGWKDFTKEDHPMFTPQQTMAHTPKPMMISYQ